MTKFYRVSYGILVNGRTWLLLFDAVAKQISGVLQRVTCDNGECSDSAENHSRVSVLWLCELRNVKRPGIPPVPYKG